jgi:quinol monooxygenase YgiN
MSNSIANELRLIADVTAKPEHIDAVRTALKNLVEPSRAEDGCLQYDLHEDLERPGHFIFFERWRDAATLAAHAKATHSVANGPILKDLIVAPTVLTRLTQIG